MNSKFENEDFTISFFSFLKTLAEDNTTKTNLANDAEVFRKKLVELVQDDR